MTPSESLDYLKTAMPLLLAFISGGGFAALLNYRKDTQAHEDVTMQSLANQLNEMLREERRRCDESMARMHSRIEFLESQVISLQAAQTIQTAQIQSVTRGTVS